MTLSNRSHSHFQTYSDTPQSVSLLNQSVSFLNQSVLLLKQNCSDSLYTLQNNLYMLQKRVLEKRVLAFLFSCLAIGLAMLITPQTAQAQSAVPAPTVSVAPDVGALWNKAPVDIKAHGLAENEYFFEGTTSVGAYKSRMIVRRPLNPWRFNGTVIVEWMNASSGFDIDVDFLSLLPLIEKEGFAYVAVTSQQVTVDFLRNRDPARYGSLNMAESPPLQPAANEVFSQAAKALLSNGNVIDPLQGLKVKRLIAIGQSQSSARLTTYVNSIHGLTLQPIFNAFVLHAGGDAPTRFPVPVFKLNSENEAPTYFGFRSVANLNYRYWEVPGSSHQPLEGNDYANSILAAGRGAPLSCPFPFQGPGGPVGIDPVLRAAVHHLNNWVISGKKPPEAPLMTMLPNGLNPAEGIIQRDTYGNALGGIRMPQQEAPVARNTPSYGCFIAVGPISIPLNLLPQYDAFDGNADPAVDPTDTYYEPASAKALYGSHSWYVTKFSLAAAKAALAGFILDFDAQQLISGAAKSDIAK